jgi:hypothetical protein
LRDLLLTWAWAYVENEAQAFIVAKHLFFYFSKTYFPYVAHEQPFTQINFFDFLLLSLSKPNITNKASSPHFGVPRFG